MKTGLHNSLKVLLYILFFLALPLLSEEAGSNSVELVRNGLFNDQSGSLAFWSVRSGGLGSVKVVPPAEPGTSAVFTANVKEISPKPWTMELLQRFETVIPKATVVHISFDYKITPGYSFNFYWQEERSPWPKLLSLHIDSPAERWQRVQMAVPVHEEFQPLSTAFSFHLAEKVGTLQLRNISAVMYPEGTNPDTLATNVNPVLGGDFYDKDWRDIATRRLERVRTIPLTVHVLGKDKAPLREVEVTATQIDRPFAFGVETSFPLFNPAAMKYNKHFAGKMLSVKDKFSDYKKMLLDKSMFSFITFNDGFIWRDYESWGKKYDKEIVKEAVKSGFEVRGHALFVPAYMFAPVLCRKMDSNELYQALMTHISALVQRHKDGIKQWNVLHGGTDYSEIYNFVGIDSLTQVFQTAEASGATLLLSDLQGLSALSDVPLKDAVELGEWLIQSGVKLGGIVLGANMKRLDVGPQNMEKRIDMVSSRLKIPVHIANFAVNSESDDFHAAVVSDYMLLFFSHQAVHSVSFAEAWAPALLNPRMSFLREDLSPRPAAALVKSLITSKWRTNFSGKTGEAGMFSGTCFLGKHHIDICFKKQNKTIQLDLVQLLDDLRNKRKASGLPKGCQASLNNEGLHITVTLNSASKIFE